MPEILENAENGVPNLAREVLAGMPEQLHHFDAQVEHYDLQIQQLAQQSEPAKRLMAIEGIGPVTTTALVATVGDARDIDAGAGADHAHDGAADIHGDDRPWTRSFGGHTFFLPWRNRP